MFRAIAFAVGLASLAILTSRSPAEAAPLPPAPLNPGAAVDDLRELFPDVQTDSHGTWVTTWMAEDPAYRGEYLSYNVAAAVSHDDGRHWDPPVLITASHNLTSDRAYAPRLATDGLGTWVTVWAVWTGEWSDTDIYFSRSTDNAATWSSPAPLSSWFTGEVDADDSAEVATDGAGGWVVTWRSQNPLDVVTEEEIFVARSTDNGAAWSTPAPIDPNWATVMALDGGPSVAHTAAGWVIAFASSRSSPAHGTDEDIFSSVSIDAGATWSAPALIDPAATSDSARDAEASVAQSNGRTIATWITPAVGSGSDVLRISISEDGGMSWSSPNTLNSALPLATFFSPAIAVAPGGKWMITWEVFSPGYDDAFDLLVALSSDNGLTWSLPSYLNSDGASDTTDEFNPRVAVSDSGMGLAVWNSIGRYGSMYGSDMDVFYTRCLEFAPDADCDLVPDSVDACPDAPGPGTIDGCPPPGLPLAVGGIAGLLPVDSPAPPQSAAASDDGPPVGVVPVAATLAATAVLGAGGYLRRRFR